VPARGVEAADAAGHAEGVDHQRGRVTAVQDVGDGVVVEGRVIGLDQFFGTADGREHREHAEHHGDAEPGPSRRDNGETVTASRRRQPFAQR
jgi:hypothetical protein